MKNENKFHIRETSNNIEIRHEEQEVNSIINDKFNTHKYVKYLHQQLRLIYESTHDKRIRQTIQETFDNYEIEYNEE